MITKHCLILFSLCLFGFTSYKKEDKLTDASSNIKINNNTVSVTLLKSSQTSSSAISNTQILQDAINSIPKEGGTLKIESQTGEYSIDGTINLRSNIIIEGNENKLIYTGKNTLFYIPANQNRITINNLELSCSNPLDPTQNSIAFDFDGTLSSKISEVYLNRIHFRGFKLSAYCKRLTLSSFNDCIFETHNGILYSLKSVDVIVNGCTFTKYSETGKTDPCFNNSYAIKSYSSTYETYPEGLNVSNSLFFRFNHNLILNDLFVAQISNCKFDNLGTIIIDWHNRIDGIEFNNCWFYSYGFTFGGTDTKNAHEYRCNISNCHFSGQNDSKTIRIYTKVSDIFVSNCIFDSDNNGTRIGIWCDGGNNFLTFTNLYFRFYSSYVQMYKSGMSNTIQNIPNLSQLPINYILYLEYPVNVRDVEGYN